MDKIRKIVINEKFLDKIKDKARNIYLKGNKEVSYENLLALSYTEAILSEVNVEYTIEEKKTIEPLD